MVPNVLGPGRGGWLVPIVLGPRRGGGLVTGHGNSAVRKGMWTPRGRLVGVLDGRTLGTVRFGERGEFLDILRLDPQARCGCSDGAVAPRGARVSLAQPSTCRAPASTLPSHFPTCNVKISVSIRPANTTTVKHYMKSNVSEFFPFWQGKDGRYQSSLIGNELTG